MSSSKFGIHYDSTIDTDARRPNLYSEGIPTLLIVTCAISFLCAFAWLFAAPKNRPAFPKTRANTERTVAAVNPNDGAGSVAVDGAPVSADAPRTRPSTSQPFGPPGTAPECDILVPTLETTSRSPILTATPFAEVRMPMTAFAHRLLNPTRGRTLPPAPLPASPGIH